MNRIETIRRCDLHSAHGADVETEEATANDGDGGNEVDITELLHHGGQPMLVYLCPGVTVWCTRRV